ncbi:MAG: hypothetical protein ACK55Z_24135 [bacterium]
MLVMNFLNCNKIKSQKVTAAEIVEVVADSTKIVHDTKKLIVRRKDNLALPEFQEKKRDAKAVDKKQAQGAKQHED